MQHLTGQWTKSRLIFLGLGVVFVGVGLWMIIPSMVS